MRVHHIINDYSLYSGGAERVVRALHVELRKHGFESYILGLKAHDDSRIPNAQSLELSSPYNYRAPYKIQRYLSKQVAPGDIVHVHLFPASIYLSGLKIFKLLPNPLIFTEHSTSNRRRGTVIGRVIDRITYTGYNQIIAISVGVEQSLVKWQPNLKKRIRVIHNGIHPHFEEPIERHPEARLRILSVGSLRPAKNYDNALKAVALLNDLDFEYDIVGAGPEAANLAEICRNLGLESKVRFVGHVDQIQPLLAAADIFLMPSRWEGFGLAAIEAMNASLPLVVSNILGLGEVVDCNPPCALLVDPEKPQSIALALRRLLASPKDRSALGKNAFHQARQFSQEKMVENYRRVYTEISGV